MKEEERRIIFFFVLKSFSRHHSPHFILSVLHTPFDASSAVTTSKESGSCKASQLEKWRAALVQKSFSLLNVRSEESSESVSQCPARAN